MHHIAAGEKMARCCGPCGAGSRSLVRTTLDPPCLPWTPLCIHCPLRQNRNREDYADSGSNWTVGALGPCGPLSAVGASGPLADALPPFISHLLVQDAELAAPPSEGPTPLTTPSKPAAQGAAQQRGQQQ